MEEHFCIAKYGCVTRKQDGMILELLHSGCCTTQSPIVFHFQFSETERKQFAFDEGVAEITLTIRELSV